jgi:hypothetical protein
MSGRRNTQTAWSALIAGAAVGAWGWRLEIALLVLVIAAARLLATVLGELPAVAVVGTLIAAFLALAPARRLLWRASRSAWLRRAWRRAVIDAGLALDVLHAPRVLRTRRIAAGDVLRVRVCRGQSVAMLDARAGELAACLRVRELRVEPERGDAAIARVTLVRRDPFDDPAPLTWPETDAEERSLWDPIPLGLDEHGEPVRVGLVERNVLIGGEPGAGKSVALSLLVAAGALDPTARVWLLDGKHVELAAWAPVAERLVVGPDGPRAIEALRQVQREMDARYRELLARGLRKVRRDDGLPLQLVVVDELAAYLMLPDRDQRKQFTELLRDLVARGRAAGVIVIAATQKPGHDVVPTSLRDLFGFRLALRCNTPQASDTILGQGWASAGADASTVPGAQRGVGFLLSEGEQPTRIRTFHLDDDELAAISERASARRADAWLADTDEPEDAS